LGGDSSTLRARRRPEGEKRGSNRLSKAKVRAGRDCFDLTRKKAGGHSGQRNVRAVDWERSAGKGKNVKSRPDYVEEKEKRDDHRHDQQKVRKRMKKPYGDSPSGGRYKKEDLRNGRVEQT